MTPSTSGVACPEKQLLICCSRTRVERAGADEIRQLLALPLDWDFLLAQAAEHSVAPLLIRQLSDLKPGAVPPEQLERLKASARANAVHSLFLSAELIRILDAFAGAGIEAIPYKGPVLAVQAYGDVALREFEDLDLVLRQSDVAAANEVLVALGFSPQFPPIFAPGTRSSLVPGEYDYRDQARHLIVELHTERTLRHFPIPPDLGALSRRLVPISLSSHTIRTFSPEDTLVFLCVHGAKDFWERLLWIADLAEFVASHPQLDWERACGFADSVRAGRMLHLGLALADRLFGFTLPVMIRSRLQADRVAASVAEQIVQRLISRGSSSLGVRASFRYRRSMVSGVLARFRYAARLTMAPAAEDWHSIHLPRPLAPLYAALRPIRLLRKYGLSSNAAAGPRS